MKDNGAANLDSIYKLLVPVQPELKKVGQDEIGKGMAVALKLLRVLDVVKVLFRSLRLDIADDVLLPIPEPKVGIPCFGLLGERCDVD